MSDRRRSESGFTGYEDRLRNIVNVAEGYLMGSVSRAMTASRRIARETQK